MIVKDNRIEIPEVFVNTTIMLQSKQVGHTQFDDYERRYPGSGDIQIRIAPALIHKQAIDIVRAEIQQALKDNPGIDIQKIQHMITSQDIEMRELGYTLLNRYTRYSGDIQKYLWNNKGNESGEYGIQELENIIYDYVERNKFNITGRII